MPVRFQALKFGFYLFVFKVVVVIRKSLLFLEVADIASVGFKIS